MNKTDITRIDADYIDEYEREFDDFDSQELEGGLIVAPFGDHANRVSIGIVWQENGNSGCNMYCIFNHSSAKYKYFAAEKHAVEWVEFVYMTDRYESERYDAEQKHWNDLSAWAERHYDNDTFDYED